MKANRWLYVVSALSGILVWTLVSTWTGRREAWDSEAYFQFGIPALCFVSAALGYLEPDRSWRWGAIPLAAQALVMLATQGFGNLWPLGLIVNGVLAVPPILTARTRCVCANEKQDAGDFPSLRRHFRSASYLPHPVPVVREASIVSHGRNDQHISVLPSAPSIASRFSLNARNVSRPTREKPRQPPSTFELFRTCKSSYRSYSSWRRTQEGP